MYLATYTSDAARCKVELSGVDTTTPAPFSTFTIIYLFPYRSTVESHPCLPYLLPPPCESVS